MFGLAPRGNAFFFVLLATPLDDFAGNFLDAFWRFDVDGLGDSGSLTDLGRFFPWFGVVRGVCAGRDVAVVEA